MQHRKATFSLMVHGGAGTLDLVGDPGRAEALRHAIGRVLAAGRALLEKGAPALDAVEQCVVLLEDDPLFNAGRGSVLNELGGVEMDAAIMDGRSLAAGAVAAVHGIANPVRLARRVMADTPHILLVGEGAMRLAERCGMPLQPDEYFLLPERLAQLERARARQVTGLDHAVERDNGKLGTVGAVARDLRGDLAAATSTGGLVNKRVGRVGDSPLVGAGVYADNRSCAVSATGVGEDLMRSVLAKTVADLVELWGLDAPAATQAAVDRLRERLDGQGGLIVIDRAGRCAGACTTPNLVHGWVEHGGATVVRLEPQHDRRRAT